jgi:hypothetical protein
MCIPMMVKNIGTLQFENNPNCSLFNEFRVLKRSFHSRFKLAHSCHRELNELNTTFFCSTSPLKAANRLKSLKLAWRFVLTSCHIYQNPFTQEKIHKFWQCRTKKEWKWYSHAVGCQLEGIRRCYFNIVHEMVDTIKQNQL